MLTNQESWFISVARISAMFLIVACHILQAYGNPWAFVVNVGVQMFFLISGFLYGRKEDLKIKTFLTTRLKKIYLPYIIYVAIAVVAIYVVTGRSIT